VPDHYAQTIAEAPDTPFDISLRPPAFSEFAGQEKVREQLLVMVEAARPASARPPSRTSSHMRWA